MQSDDPVIQEIIKKALGVFIHELEQHLEELKIICDGIKDKSGAGFNSTENLDIKSELLRFHKIKGGAQFLGLEEIAVRAQQIELLLKHNSSGDAYLLDHLSTFVDEGNQLIK
jgi:HPt (histidine-containing phosphotransfer) domain-containing protein